MLDTRAVARPEPGKAEPRDRRTTVTRLVLLAAVTATAAKLLLAATTTGTNDVMYWTAFAAAVDEFGPIGIYGHDFVEPYNHAPLAGWLLVLVNFGQDLGLGLPFLMRIPSSLADAATCWIVFRLLGERTSPAVAGWAAAGLVWSPVLVVISGFHGNTDTVFVALTLASFWLLTRKGRPLLAGICVGLAVSLKLVPVVSIPWLLFLAFRAGRPVLARFVAGGGLVFAVFWLPVLLTAWPEFRDNVLTYRGVALRQWGIAEFLEADGRPGAELWLAEHGTYAVVLAALVPFVGLVTRQMHQDVVGLGLTFMTMLLLTPAYGMQYLSWALAAAFLVSVRGGWLYNVAASPFVLSVYSLWSGGGGPWSWDQASAVPFSLAQLMLMSITWTALLVAWLDGMVFRRRGRMPDIGAPQQRIEGDSGESGR